LLQQAVHFHAVLREELLLGYSMYGDLFGLLIMLLFAHLTISLLPLVT